MPLPPTYTESLPNGPAFDMILAEGGAFDMGADENDQEAYDREKPLHKVQLDAFYIGKYPVTQELWTVVMGNNPSYFQDTSGGQRPVEQVSWQDTQHFLNKLNKQTGKNYRLPTEAEWEYAARGGHKNSEYHYLYAGSDKLKEVGWYRGNSHGETKEVGQKDPNELGLYDMSGNVFEWCSDWFDENYYKECLEKGSSVSLDGPKLGQRRILRGGAWHDYLKGCRIVDRASHDPESKNRFIGFRLVLPMGHIG